MKVEVIDHCFGRDLRVDDHGFETLSSDQKTEVLFAVLASVKTMTTTEEIVRELVETYGDYLSDGEACDQCGHYGGVTTLDISPVKLGNDGI